MPGTPRLTRVILLAAACAAAFTLAGCRRKGIEELVGTELFSLSMGRMEDQVDLFQLQSSMIPRRNSVFMREGWFTVANGSAGKIMVFNSYGDLIFLLYNPQNNPAPTILGSPTADPAGEASTRGAVPYPFADIGAVAVASDRLLYVDDSVPDAKAVKDAARGITRSRVVLRFDRKGKPLGFIGEEGIGGSPFPYIASLYVTSSDQLVVVCRLPDSWQVFWYSREGALLYQVDVSPKSLPEPPSKGKVQSLVNIMPDLQNPALFMLIYTYSGDSDSSNPALQDAVAARVYSFNLRTQAYSPRYVEFPQNPPHREKNGLKTTDIPSPPSDLLGVGAGGQFYLLAYTDTNLYTLQILDRSGRLRTQRRLVIEDSALAFRDLHLSSTGILYGMLADKARVHFTWWRSDLLPKGE
jgi:hypothetical protein